MTHSVEKILEKDPVSAPPFDETKFPPFSERLRIVARACAKAPSTVASVCPSSSALTTCIADRDYVRHASRIVDLGPGTGGTTRAILDQLPANGKILAIEMTAEFIPTLLSIHDPRLTVVQGDAIRLEQFLSENRLGSPDLIVSGVPFSSLRSAAAHAIVATIHRTLRKDGVFLAYQLRGQLKRIAKPYFGEPETTEWVWWNLPPLRVFAWIKR